MSDLRGLTGMFTAWVITIVTQVLLISLWVCFLDLLVVLLVHFIHPFRDSLVDTSSHTLNAASVVVSFFIFQQQLL